MELLFLYYFFFSFHSMGIPVWLLDFLFYHIFVNKVEIKNLDKINSSNNFFKISVVDLAMDNKI